MTTRKLSLSALVTLFVAAVPFQASAQTIEITGSRALGMGGAFVAVADDSSATWWNPAGLAAGPFLDIAIGHARTERSEQLPANRNAVSQVTLATPPFGFGYYRLRITEIPAMTSTENVTPGREVGQAGGAIGSLALDQFGVTVLHSVLPGVHVGSTLKYLRGTFLTAAAGDLPVDDLLDQGDALTGGQAQNRFDLDAGVLAVAGPVRVGLVAKNLVRPLFGDDEGPSVQLSRQFRVGAAFDVGQASAVPLVIAVDADLRGYPTASGDRRVVAIGAEHWLLAHRLGVRGGARFNTAGAQDRAATGGISVAARSGLYLDGHVVGGGSADDRGWGIAARVSF